jgi:hypothetical protein
MGTGIQAVRDTYRNAALGQPVKAFTALSEKLGPDTMELLFANVLGGRMPEVETRPPPEEDDPYATPLRFTDRRDFPAYEMLIEGILPADPRGCVGYLCGLSQSFKSYLSIDWGCHISQGMPWQGHATEQAQVYYVAAEGQYADLMSRLRAWEAEHQAKAENLYGQLCPVNLTCEAAIELMIKRVDAAGLKPRLIILDTLSQCGGAMDENTSGDARAIYRSCKEFGKSFGATVVVVAHSGKSEGAIIRGSSAFFDDSDFVYQMSRPGWQGGGLDCTLNCRKIKSGRMLLNHQMCAREREWEEGERRGKDLILTQMVMRSAFEASMIPGR